MAIPMRAPLLPPASVELWTPARPPQPLSPNVSAAVAATPARSLLLFTHVPFGRSPRGCTRRKDEVRPPLRPENRLMYPSLAQVERALVSFAGTGQVRGSEG